MGAVAAVGYHVYTSDTSPFASLGIGAGGALDVNATSKGTDTGPASQLIVPDRPPIPRETAPASQPPITQPPVAAKHTGPATIRPPITPPKDTKTVDKTPVGPRPTNLNPITPITPPSVGGFPRRMLAVIPANYAFVTPIAYGANGPRSLTTVVQQFGEL